MYNTPCSFFLELQVLAFQKLTKLSHTRPKTTKIWPVAILWAATVSLNTIIFSFSKKVCES